MDGDNGLSQENPGSADNPGFSDTGDQGGQNPQQQNPNGGSENPNGAQPDSRDEKIKQLEQNNKALNKLLIDARRNSSQRQPQNPNGNGDSNPYETPEGQYAAAIQIATGQLRADLEPIMGLYPELPPAEAARIRMNPWAFAYQQSYFSGDYKSALLEIEQSIADRVEELASEKGNGGAGNGQPNQVNRQQPAQINNNPAGENSKPAAPGSSEDNNPWTMPMDKLEQTANSEVAKQKAARK